MQNLATIIFMYVCKSVLQCTLRTLYHIRNWWERLLLRLHTSWPDTRNGNCNFGAFDSGSNESKYGGASTSPAAQTKKEKEKNMPCPTFEHSFSLGINVENNNNFIHLLLNSKPPLIC
jgi:hypothetical protein